MKLSTRAILAAMPGRWTSKSVATAMPPSPWHSSGRSASTSTQHASGVDSVVLGAKLADAEDVELT